MISAWRVVKSKYARSAMDGEGARRFPGRWNVEGVPMVYLADSLALAALEILVHVEHAEFMPRFVSIEVEIPEALVSDADAGIDGMDPVEAREAGTRWIEGEASSVLRVPTVVIPRARLYLVNPRHPDAAQLNIGRPEPFEFDPRLLPR